MSEELKACPFCGNINKLGDSFGYIICKGCSIIGGSKEAWNTRPLEDALRSRVEELENELAEAGKNQSEYHNTVLAQEKEVARLREMVRFIPVTERLPEDYETVFVYDDIDEKTILGQHVRQVPEWDTTHGYYHGNSYGRITHWMPLPEPPEVSHE